jgi:hypothetical protein
MKLQRSNILLLFVADIHQMAVGVMKTIGAAATEIALAPADAKPLGLYGARATLERDGAHGAPGDTTHAGLRRLGRL